MEGNQSRLYVVPVTRAQANAYVELLHRHNGALPSDKFAVAVADDDGVVHGVAIAGLPKARMLHDGYTLEVNRVCTDGHPNACSALYGACVRTAKAMGYARVVTYTLVEESGSSLRAAGFVKVAEVKGESWNRRMASKGVRSYRDQHDTGDKVRWEIAWQRPALVLVWPAEMTPEPLPSLFG